MLCAVVHYLHIPLRLPNSAYVVLEILNANTQNFRPHETERK